MEGGGLDWEIYCDVFLLGETIRGCCEGGNCQTLKLQGVFLKQKRLQPEGKRLSTVYGGVRRDFH